MPGPSPLPPLPPHRRLAAWVVCGPLGHLYGGVADWVELFTRWYVFRPAGDRFARARRALRR